MRTKLVTLAAAALGLISTIAVAAPASADHLLDVSPGSCYMGVFTTDIWGDVTTKNSRHVSIKVLGDGTVVATCAFKGLPAKRYNEVLETMWYRPAPGTTLNVTACLLPSYEGRPSVPAGLEDEDWYGNGTITYGPGGQATATCTFSPDYWY